jgi:hypothetical protein
MPLVGVGTAPLQAMTTINTCADAAVVSRRVSSGVANASRCVCVCVCCVFECGIERIRSYTPIERESKRTPAWLSVHDWPGGRVWRFVLFPGGVVCVSLHGFAVNCPQLEQRFHTHVTHILLNEMQQTALRPPCTPTPTIAVPNPIPTDGCTLATCRCDLLGPTANATDAFSVCCACQSQVWYCSDECREVHRAEGGCGGHTTQREALQAATSAKGASLGPAAVEMHSGSVETASTTRVTAEGHDAVVDASGAAAERVPQEGEVTGNIADEPSISPVHTLPPDVLAIVFGFVDGKTLLLSVHSVCRSWRGVMAMM